MVEQMEVGDGMVEQMEVGDGVVERMEVGERQEDIGDEMEVRERHEYVGDGIKVASRDDAGDGIVEGIEVASSAIVVVPANSKEKKRKFRKQVLKFFTNYVDAKESPLAGICQSRSVVKSVCSI